MNSPIDAKDIFLSEDAWYDYVRPFRIIEELHVTMAISGYFLRLSYSLMHNELITERPHLEKVLSALLSQISSIVGFPIQSRNLSSPQIEVTAEGIATNMNRLTLELETLFQQHHEKIPQLWSFWNRDKPLLNVASMARKKRTEHAFSKL